MICQRSFHIGVMAEEVKTEHLAGLHPKVSSDILVKQARLRICSCIGSDENSGFKVLTKNNGKDMPCAILKNV